MKEKIKILHCPHVVAGNAQNLACSERKIGLDSWSVALEAHPFGYKCDEIMCKKNESIIIREIKRWMLFFRALLFYDIIHLNFGSTIFAFRIYNRPVFSFQKKFFSFKALYYKLFEYKDLQILSLFKKIIFVTYQGDDARQKDFSLNHFKITFATEVEPEYYPEGSDEQKRKNISMFDKYADCIFALNPDLLHVLPERAKFLSYANIDIDDWKYIGLNSEYLKKPLVIHAPSHKGVKGTKYILAAVKQLEAENIPFEFILVEGMSNADARKIYENADLLIDQLLAGWYGGLAVELMAMGKPVICYIREDDLKFIPDEMRENLPLINATSDTIYSVLKEWLTVKKELLNDVGKRSRLYVEKWHDPVKIAKRLKADYEAILESKRKNDNYSIF